MVRIPTNSPSVTGTGGPETDRPRPLSERSPTPQEEAGTLLPAARTIPSVADPKRTLAQLQGLLSGRGMDVLPHGGGEPSGAHRPADSTTQRMPTDTTQVGGARKTTDTTEATRTTDTTGSAGARKGDTDPSTDPSTGPSTDPTTLPGAGSSGSQRGSYGKPVDVALPQGATWQPPAKEGPFSTSSNVAWVGPNDFAQGGSGNCGSLASLAAGVSKDPDLIRNGIKPAGETVEGVPCYSVSLFDKNGQKQDVVVSAQFPSTGSTAINGDWALLYEKAMASQLGGYSKLEGANPTDLVQMLTGKKMDQINDGSAALEAVKSGKLVTAVGVPGANVYFDAKTGENLGDKAGDNPNAVLLHDRHYYGVTDSGNGSVLLHNPWNTSGNGSGNFTLSEEAFKKIFWGYAVEK